MLDELQGKKHEKYLFIRMCWYNSINQLASIKMLLANYNKPSRMILHSSFYRNEWEEFEGTRLMLSTIVAVLLRFESTGIPVMYLAFHHRKHSL